MEGPLSTTDPNEYVEITVELVDNKQNSVEQAKRSLVGKFISDKMLNRGAVKIVVSKAWGEPEGLQISDLGPNIFLFTFKDCRDTLEVMRKGPWFIMNQLLSIQRWIPEVFVFEVDFSLVPFWVQLHGMPFGTINTKNASKIGSQIGQLL